MQGNQYDDEDEGDEKKEELDKKIPIYKVKTLEEAVIKAKETIKPGQILLFSPASASFDMFKNAYERGKKFKTAVMNI